MICSLSWLNLMMKMEEFDGEEVDDEWMKI